MLETRLLSQCGGRTGDQTGVVVQKGHCSPCEAQTSPASVATGRPARGSRLLMLYSWPLSRPWEAALDTPVEGRSLGADLPQEAWPAQP